MKVSIEVEYDDLSDKQREGLQALLGTRTQNAKPSQLTPAKMDDLTYFTRPAVEKIHNKHKKHVFKAGLRGKRLRAYITAVIKNEGKPLRINEISRRVKLSHSGTWRVLNELRKKRIIEDTRTRPKMFFYRGGQNAEV